jgi:hypothetical protein
MKEENVEWIKLAEDRVPECSVINRVMKLRIS